jgi:hypothetical protein
VAVLKLIGGPGSLTLLGVLLLVGLALMKLLPRRQLFLRGWLGGVITLYIALALPGVANAIVRELPPVPVSSPAALRGLDTLIVLDGDNRRGRVSEARTAYEAIGACEVWVFGDAWMVNALFEAGVPADAIRFGGNPPTTLDQMRRVQSFVAAGHHAALVASRLQMPRIAALAAALGVHLPLLSGAIDSEPPTAGARRFVPSYVALRTSRDAIYELAALAYYRNRGWIG